MNEIAAPVKGTRPEGAVNELDASRKVREMFTQIAPRYDLLNHLLSFELDRLWRARAAKCLRSILDRSDALVLDLCSGTGDLAFALARGGKARILGADFAHTMLVRARAKAASHPALDGANTLAAMPFFEADALRLPFADASFDLVTSAFGFRNLANYKAVFSGRPNLQRCWARSATSLWTIAPGPLARSPFTPVFVRLKNENGKLQTANGLTPPAPLPAILPATSSA